MNGFSCGLGLHMLSQTKRAADFLDLRLNFTAHLFILRQQKQSNICLTSETRRVAKLANSLLTRWSVEGKNAFCCLSDANIIALSFPVNASELKSAERVTDRKSSEGKRCSWPERVSCGKIISQLCQAVFLNFTCLP